MIFLGRDFPPFINYMKSKILVLLFIFFNIFTINVVASEPTQADKNRWIEEAPTYNGNLLGGNTYTNNGVTIEPADEFWVDSANTVSVYYPRQEGKNNSGVIYLFTSSTDGNKKYRNINKRVNNWENDPSYDWKDLSFVGFGNWNAPFDSDFMTLFGYYDGQFKVSTVDIFSVITSYDPLYVNADYTAYSSQDLYNQLLARGFDPNPPRDPNLLKEPYFYLKTEGIKADSDVEYTITWDLNGSYVDPAQDYNIQVYVSKDNRSETQNFQGFNDKKPIRSTDVYPCNLGGVEFSFTLSELRNMYLFGGGFLDNMFYIYIRVVDSNNIPVTNKWVWFRVAKRIEITASGQQPLNPDGTLGDSEILTDRENGILDYTDGRPIGDNINQDGERDSNGSSVSPAGSAAGINNYTPTSSQELGINYGTSLNDLSSNLGGLVNTLSNLPTLFSILCSWLPSWLITLIAVSIGMIVVIGTAKLILR